MGKKSGTSCRVDFQKTMWIELIGLDVRKDDYGVHYLLNKAGFIPDAMLLLLWNADFIHQYQPNSEDFSEAFLRDDCCAYYGRRQGEEHSRQRWRNKDLKGLIACLHEYDIEVYLSVFDQQMSNAAAKLFQLKDLPEQWVDQHPEVKYTLRDGRLSSSLCPWKRLNNGSFYEDFLLQQLQRLLPDFGFDGWHAADGFGHPRFPIYQGDFSDDMVQQFGGDQQILMKCDGDLPALSHRAESIWQHQRLEWIEFHCQRRTRFFQKLLSGLREMGRKVIINSCWTREPFEAKYRYGVDDFALSVLGFQAWVIESPISVIELEGWRKDDCDSLYKFIPSLGRIRACLPTQRLLLLNTIKDTMEQYNSIRHAPMLLEAELASFGSVHSIREGKLQPALDGIVSCLSDGLSKCEWGWLLERWNSSFSAGRISWNQGVKVIYDQDALENELRSYCQQPFCSSYHWYYLLLGAGAPLLETIEWSQARTAQGPFLVIHPAFFPAEKLQDFMAERGNETFSCGLTKLPSLKVATKEPFAFPPDSWLNPLPEPVPRPAAVKKLVSRLIEFSGAPWIVSGQAHVWQQNTSSRSLLFVRNDRNLYQWVKVALPSRIRRLKAVSEYLKPIIIEKEEETSHFSVKLPPLGLVVLELILRRA